MKKRKKSTIKIGDTVKVISGSDKGTVGKVLKLFPNTNKMVVEGINYKSKHVPPKNEETTVKSGGIIQKEAAIHNSNVKLHSNDS